MSLYSFARRTKEIGIRKAHGARPGDIIRILLGELYTGVGIAMVLAVHLVCLMSNSWLRYFANRTTVAWWIFLLGGLAAALCALLSVGLQTVRAARRNPVTALRYE
jgi:putative ABC transport system permease protein